MKNVEHRPAESTEGAARSVPQAAHARRLGLRQKARGDPRFPTQQTLPLGGVTPASRERGARRRRTEDWRIDERSRSASRTGIAAARAVLAAIEQRRSEEGSDADAA